MIINHKSKQYDQRYKSWRSEVKLLKWDGKDFQIDSQSRELITQKLLQILLDKVSGLETPNFTWRTSDNTEYQFTPSSFMNFYIAITEHIERKVKFSWKEKDKIKKDQK